MFVPIDVLCNLLKVKGPNGNVEGVAIEGTIIINIDTLGQDQATEEVALNLAETPPHTNRSMYYS